MSQTFGPDQPRSPVSASRHRLATGQHSTASRVPGAESGIAHLEHGITEPRPTESVTLTATCAHPENAAFQGRGGKPPTATVQIVNAAEAATEIGKPSDFRAAPAGAAGIHRQDWHPADINTGRPVQPRPAGIPVPGFHRTPSELQGPAPAASTISQQSAARYARRAPGE